MSTNQSPELRQTKVNYAKPDSVEVANKRLIEQGGSIGKLIVDITAPFDQIVDESLKKLKGVGSVSRSKSNT